MTRFGILGSGAVGQALAKGLKAHGYEIRIGTRNPEKLTEFSAATGIEAGQVADVAQWSEALVLAVLGRAATEVLREAGDANLFRKLVIDTTNPISADAPENGVLKYFTGPNSSLMEELQTAFPNVRFVKAFNSVGSDMMVHPDFARAKPTMFICGNDQAAKADVTHILELLGWDVADMGTAMSARAIEPLAQLWCIPGFREQSWHHAFRLLRL